MLALVKVECKQFIFYQCQNESEGLILNELYKFDSKGDILGPENFER